MTLAILCIMVTLVLICVLLASPQAADPAWGEMPMPAAQWPAPTAQLPAPSFAEGVLSTAEETGERESRHGPNPNTDVLTLPLTLSAGLT